MNTQMEFTRIKNFIDDEWVEGSGVAYVPLYKPSTGESIGEVPLSSMETNRAAAESSHAAYHSWRQVPIAKRVKYLFDLRRAMEDQSEELTVSIAIDQAKHISEARGEVQRVI